MTFPGNGFVPTVRHDTYPAIAPEKADLTGKTVVITGASKGIGKATALSYAKAGASGFVLMARSDLSSVKDEILSIAKSAGKEAPKVLCLKVDTTSRAAIEDAAKQVGDVFGKVDVLVNNAGYLMKQAPVGESDPDEWWYVWQVNLNGVYLMTKYFLPLVLKSELKSIVMMSSIAAHLIHAGTTAYSGTKLVLLRIGEFLTEEYGERGLIVIGMHPGGIPTDLSSNLPTELHQYLTETVGLAGDSVVWLTKERREWLAGRYFDVSWDVDELLAKQDDIVQGDLLKFRMAF